MVRATHTHENTAAEALSPIYSQNDIKPLFEVMPKEWTAGATVFPYFPLHSKNEHTFYVFGNSPFEGVFELEVQTAGSGIQIQECNTDRRSMYLPKELHHQYSCHSSA